MAVITIAGKEYELERKIHISSVSDGSPVRVFRAYDCKTNEQVIIKAVTGEQYTDKFRAWAEKVSGDRLFSNYIVGCKTAGTAEISGSSFFCAVTDKYCDELCCGNKPSAGPGARLSADKVRAEMNTLVNMIRLLHVNGLYHRDLTPGCIYKRSENYAFTFYDINAGRRRFIDLLSGYSFLDYDEIRDEEYKKASWQYFSPAIRNHRYNSGSRDECYSLSNIYTIGVICYELLTGERFCYELGKDAEADISKIERKIDAVCSDDRYNLKESIIKALSSYNDPESSVKALYFAVLSEESQKEKEIIEKYSHESEPVNNYPQEEEFNRLMKVYQGETLEGASGKVGVRSGYILESTYRATKKVIFMENHTLKKEYKKLLESTINEVGTYEKLNKYSRENNVCFALTLNSSESCPEGSKTGLNGLEKLKKDYSDADGNTEALRNISEYGWKMYFSGGLSLDRYFRWISGCNKKYREELIINTAAEILTSLRLLHSAGICHMDIKPQNMLLIKNEKGFHIVFMDFNSAIDTDKIKEKDSKEEEKAKEAKEEIKKLTTLVGTPGYIAPEVSVLAGDRSCPLDPVKADIYSVSVMLYRLITGGMPGYLAKRSRDDGAGAMKLRDKRFGNEKYYYHIIPKPSVFPNGLNGSGSLKALLSIVLRGMDERPEKRPDLDEYCRITEKLRRKKPFSLSRHFRKKPFSSKKFRGRQNGSQI